MSKETEMLSRAQRERERKRKTITTETEKVKSKSVYLCKNRFMFKLCFPYEWHLSVIHCSMNAYYKLETKMCSIFGKRRRRRTKKYENIKFSHSLALNKGEIDIYRHVDTYSTHKENGTLFSIEKSKNNSNAPTTTRSDDKKKLFETNSMKINIEV